MRKSSNRGVPAVMRTFQGRYVHAEDIQTWLVDACIRKLGPSHITTLRSILNLAGTLRMRAYTNKAGDLLVKVYNISQETFGPDHHLSLEVSHWWPGYEQAA